MTTAATSPDRVVRDVIGGPHNRAPTCRATRPLRHRAWRYRL